MGTIAADCGFGGHKVPRLTGRQPISTRATASGPAPGIAGLPFNLSHALTQSPATSEYEKCTQPEVSPSHEACSHDTGAAACMSNTRKHLWLKALHRWRQKYSFVSN